MITKILNTLEAKGRIEYIPDRTGKILYMIRYYLLFNSKDNKQKKFSKFINAFIHIFKSSDDPFYHNHPWPWLRIVLKGWYWEHRLGEKERKKVGRFSIAFRRSNDFHWVELEPGVEPITLFIHFKRCRDWGFINTKGQWQYHEEFLKDRANDIQII